MTFDKQHVLNETQRILASTQLPGGTGSVEGSGWVERVIAQDGNLTLILKAPQDAGPALAEVKQSLEQQLSSIAGVTKVQLLEKKAPGPAPAGAAPPGAGFGAQSVPGVRHVVAVASGKGGVGKSTVAVNLAAELSRSGQRVGLLDSDVYGPSIPKMLGMEGQRPRAVGEDRILPLEKHGITTISIGFLLEESSPVIWRGPMVTGLLKQFLFQVEWGELDYLLIDMPPGTGDAQLTLVQSIALSGGVIVTTPQDVALLDVQRGIEMFQRVEVPVLGVVENMSVFRCPHCGQDSEIFPTGGGKQAALKYGVPFLGAIPLDASYARAGDEGRPLVLTDAGSTMAEVMGHVASEIRTMLP